MNSIRKWIFRPKRSDTAYLAQFYYADEELNLVAAELDSFDGRKDPERCTSLVNQLRRCQDAVLGIVEKIMGETIPNSRASRDYRVKFPDDVLQESLAGQLWFGAECLAAGSSILNHEVESASMRPLAKTLTRQLDQMRSLLREQSLKNQTTYTDKIIEMLIEFDKLFSEFELSYVSAMVPVKTMREHDLLQEVMVLFCETVQRALKLRLLSQEQLDAYDPALMFTIPRLAIVCGLLVYPEGPLNPDMDPLNMSEMFRPFQTLLFKIRELLWTLSREELWLLEKSLCSTDDATRADLTNLQAERGYTRPQPAGCEATNSPSTPVESDTEDEDNSDPVNMNRGVMVHSDSTMTVVERVNVSSDLTAVDTNGLESDESDDPEQDTTHSAALDDAVARRLQHSKSWPKTMHRTSHSIVKPHPQTAHIASNDENSDPVRVTQGQQSQHSHRRGHEFNRRGHEFNFNLPYNTGSQEALAAPVSLEVSFAHVHEANRVKARSRRPGFIYIAQSEDEDEEEENPSTAQQISFITDAFCQLFNPNTPIGSAVVRLKSGATWAQTSAIRDGATECNTQSEGGNMMLERSYNESEGLVRHPPSCRRWFSMPAGEVGRTDALANAAVVCDITDSSAAAAAVDNLPLEGVAGPTPTSCHNCHADSVSGLSLDDTGGGVALPVTQTDLILGDAHLKLPAAAACDDLSINNNDEALSAEENGSSGGDSEEAEECIDDGAEVLTAAAAAIESSETAAEDVALVTLGYITNDSLTNWSAMTQSVALEPVMQSAVSLESGASVTQSHAAQTRNVSTSDGCQKLESPDTSLTNRKVIGNSGKRKIYSRTGREDVSGEPNCGHSVGRAAGRSAVNCRKAEVETQRTSAVEKNSCYTCLEYDWDRERSLQNCSYCSSETSSYTSENHDDEEIAMAIQAAEVAARNEARSRFKSSTDLIHRLFVCISGVADQLQTNYASDLRHILKAVFECNTSDTVVEKQTTTAATLQEFPEDRDNDASEEDLNYGYESSQPSVVNSRVTASQESVAGQQDSSDSSEPPEWIPDEQSSHCMACRVAFTFVRRRHHCRNCGKLFCSHCSSNSVPLPQFGHAKPVRVCNRCYMFRVTPFTTMH